MADSTPPPVSLPSRCPTCGFENPPSILYCQDCGTKLDIAPPSYLRVSAPAVPPSETVAESVGSAPAPTRKPPRILSVHRERPKPPFAFSVLKLVIYAALIAAVVLAFRVPSNLPPPATPMDQKSVGEIRAGLDAVARRGSHADAPWSRLNAYLASVLVPVPPRNAFAAAFVRAFLIPKPGGFSFIVQKAVKGFPIYTTVTYKIVALDGRLALRPTGAALGQLPLPAAAAPIVQRITGDLSGALSLELGVLQRAKAVRLAPDHVVIDFGNPRP